MFAAMKNEEVPAWVWVEIGAKFQKIAEFHEGFVEVAGFRLRGRSLNLWLNGINNHVVYKDILYKNKMKENATTLFRDTYGIRPGITVLSDNVELSHFLAFIFKHSDKFVTDSGEMLFDKLVEDSILKILTL